MSLCDGRFSPGEGGSCPFSLQGTVLRSGGVLIQAPVADWAGTCSGSRRGARIPSEHC